MAAMRFIDKQVAVGALVLATAATPTPAATPQTPLGITAGTNALLRDGKRWQPRGFTLVGELPPTGRPTDANLHYNQAELDVAKVWHADTIRFQVSQPSLDPEDSHMRSFG